MNYVLMYIWKAVIDENISIDFINSRFRYVSDYYKFGRLELKYNKPHLVLTNTLEGLFRFYHCVEREE